MHKEYSNLEIANLLRNISASYQIKDPQKNRFKIIAYERAATSIEHLTSELKDIWDEKKLDEVPGVGPSIAKHISDLFEKGKSEHFEEIQKGIPLSVFELMKVEGIGPKSAIKLAQELGIKDKKDALKKLKEAVKKGKVQNLEGFGEKSEEEIQKAITEVKKDDLRMLLPYASEITEKLISYMDEAKLGETQALGSVRRKVSTVGDIDLICATNTPEKALEHFTTYKDAKRVIEKGEHKASILLGNNLRIDLLVSDPESFGAALQHFTGSKQHNIALREYANKLGYSLSEYGIKDIKKRGLVKKFKTEESFYNFLKLDYIPPELREDTGEIEIAKEGKIPKLVELSEIKADLQIHSDFDIETSHDLGLSSMKTIVEKANELGYEYLAFTEHNPSQKGHSQNDTYTILKRKKDYIEKINDTLSKSIKYRVMKVFNSLEIDILPSGELPLDDKSLDLLDFALVSIHSSFKLSKNQMTERVLKALSHPKVKIFAHPTARIIGKREGVELDWKKIFEFCKTNNKLIEINADPARLDLPDFLVREGKEYDIKFTLGTDSHHVDSLDNMIWGVNVAKRGWLKKNDIVNTLNLNDFEKLLKS